MNKREKLTVTKREITGKKVRKLRRDGTLPGNIYGKDFKSTAVQLPVKEFKKIYAISGGTGLVDLEYNGEIIPVLIHNVHVNQMNDEPLHADFYKVNLKEKITAKIPVEAVGEPKAVADKVGLLEQPMMEIEIEALPTELPEKIEVNVEKLAAVNEQILVSDITVPTGVAILSDQSQVVFKIGELVTKEMEEQMAADEAAVEEAKAEEAVGEKAAEGEAEKEVTEAGEKAVEEGSAVTAEPKKEEKPKE
ncbi:MAG: 50S ribosomal protein L25 [Candidatus Levyibacteriota bacterium]